MEPFPTNQVITKRNLGWDEYHQLINKIYHKINLQFEDVVLFPVPRGGVIPAVILSHLSDNRLKIEYDLNKLKEYPNPLLVEDILDTGKTVARLYEKQNQEYPVVSLFYRETSLVRPVLYGEATTDWIIFPYEKDDTVGQYDKTI